MYPVKSISFAKTIVTSLPILPLLVRFARVESPSISVTLNVPDEIIVEEPLKRDISVKFEVSILITSLKKSDS